jgi:kinetochore protein Mis13/DSN1
MPHEPLLDNPTFLSPEDQAIIEGLKPGLNLSSEVSARLNSITASLGSTIDAFADGIHQIGQYRIAAERVADKVLRACAEKLEDRDREGGRRALRDEGSKQNDAMAVLRSLSRLEP